MAYTNDIKPAGADSFLLKEDTFYLLLETGNKIVIATANGFTYDTKPSTSFTNDIKP